MANDIVTLTAQESNSTSPFDSIRRYRADGSEYWSARELMKMLGYIKWQKFQAVIETAIENIEFTGESASCHTLPVKVKLATTRGVAVDSHLDHQLSRFACYHVALACDGRGKPEVKAANQYFVTKTREAEVLVPALSEELELARLQNQNLQLRLQVNELDNTMILLHGKSTVLALRGCSDAIVRDEVKVTEVINLNSGSTEVFLSADQLKSEVMKRTGQKVKSQKQFIDELRNAGRDDLLVAVTRPVTAQYVKPAHLDEAIAIVYSNGQQTLLGQ